MRDDTNEAITCFGCSSSRLLSVQPAESRSVVLSQHESGRSGQYVQRVQRVFVNVYDVCVLYLLMLVVWWDPLSWDVVLTSGWGFSQRAGPSGNIDVPDISQALSDDLHDGAGWGLSLLLSLTRSISVFWGKDLTGLQFLEIHNNNHVDLRQCATFLVSSIKLARSPCRVGNVRII